MEMLTQRCGHVTARKFAPLLTEKESLWALGFELPCLYGICPQHAQLAVFICHTLQQFCGIIQGILCKDYTHRASNSINSAKGFNMAVLCNGQGR